MRYILDPADLTERELGDILDLWEEVDDPLDPEAYARRNFPGETFRVLRERASPLRRVPHPPPRPRNLGEAVRPPQQLGNMALFPAVSGPHPSPLRGEG